MSNKQNSIPVLQKNLLQHANPKTRDWWQNYVKDAAPFLGVKMQDIRSVLHDWYKHEVAGVFNAGQQGDLALSLMRLPHTEEKLAGTIFLQEILLPKNYLNVSDDIDRFAALFCEGHIYDWNICDWFCVQLLSALIKKEGMPAATAIANWYSAENLWQARASVVAFVYCAEREYYPLIETSCEVLIARPERFAKTAVGWMLREINKHNHEFAVDFIERNLPAFSGESLKNAMKYFEATERKQFLLSHKKRNG